MLTELSPEVLDQLSPLPRGAAAKPLRRNGLIPAGLDGRRHGILAALANEDLVFESLQAHCQLPTDVLAATLLQLEIQGLVCHRDGRIGINSPAGPWCGINLDID